MDFHSASVNFVMDFGVNSPVDFLGRSCTYEEKTQKIYSKINGKNPRQIHAQNEKKATQNPSTLCGGRADMSVS